MEHDNASTFCITRQESLALEDELSAASSMTCVDSKDIGAATPSGSLKLMCSPSRTCPPTCSATNDCKGSDDEMDALHSDFEVKPSFQKDLVLSAAISDSQTRRRWHRRQKRQCFRNAAAQYQTIPKLRDARVQKPQRRRRRSSRRSIRISSGWRGDATRRHAVIMRFVTVLEERAFLLERQNVELRALLEETEPCTKPKSGSTET